MMRIVILLSLTAIVSECRFVTVPTGATPAYRVATASYGRSNTSFPTAGSVHDRYCPEPPLANQSLHRLVNTIPLKRLVLRYPRVNKTLRYGLVLLVNSAANETAERNEIRRQWANKEESLMQKSGRSLVIFVVGRSAHIQLEKESDAFGDLLQFDIEDTYRNLVYKIEAGMRWIKARVGSEFVAKIDSDTAVHIDRLYMELSKYEKERSDLWITCSSFPNSKPVRDTCSPWYISEEDYPLDYFPPYCNGPGYAMKRDLFEKIVKRMKKHKVFEVEDAFITGVVASDIGDISMMQRIADPEYSELTDCYSNDLGLSILSTRYQLDGSTKSSKNITSAWKVLKTAKCRDIWRYGSTIKPALFRSSTLKFSSR